MNETQIFVLIVAIVLVAITVSSAVTVNHNARYIENLQDTFHRLKVHVSGDILDINRKLRAMEDKFRVMEQMEFIEKVKKICDEETFSYVIFDHIENGYADIRIFSKELNTFFLSEISKICNYELKERTERSIIIRVNLKGE